MSKDIRLTAEAMPEESANENELLIRRVRECATNFQSKPTAEFLGKVVLTLKKFLTLDEASYYLVQLPRKYGSFPKLNQINDDCHEIYRKKSFAKDQARKEAEVAHWVSKRAPGTPPMFEALFKMILDGKSDTRAFQGACERTGLVDEQIWAAYEDWTHGKVNDVILNRSVKIMGRVFK